MNRSTPGSARKKKRQHRNSQGDGRHRKPSTSSSVCSSDYDQKDLDEAFESMSFDDLEERKQSPARETTELNHKNEGTIDTSETLFRSKEDRITSPESSEKRYCTVIVYHSCLTKTVSIALVIATIGFPYFIRKCHLLFTKYV